VKEEVGDIRLTIYIKSERDQERDSQEEAS
jgi:hypothetical protein